MNACDASPRDAATAPSVSVVAGDIVDADAEVIVNAWNRNIIPWFLLWPQGVSGAIKRRAGFAPFNELLFVGPMPLGSARLTSAGRLGFRGIIHVAGIDMLWRSSEASIRDCVASAMQIVNTRGFASVAFPVIGAGTGGFDEAEALHIMLDAFSTIRSDAAVTVVRFAKT